MTMSWEGYAWLVLKACGTNSSQLLQLLQPCQGRFPTSEAEYNALAMSLRRMGHILEGAPGNVSNQLRRAPQQGFFNDAAPAFIAMDADPWQATNADPWQQSRDPWQGATGSSSSTWNPAPVAPQAPAASQSSAFRTAVEDDTGSETVSTTGVPDYSDPTLTGLTPAELDEQFFFQYQKSKAIWRKHICIDQPEK